MVSFIDQFLNRERFNVPGVAKVGIGGFVLFARVSETTALTAKAPTSYVETGSSLNDHIICDPEQVTIEGLVGDIYRAPDTSVLQITPLTNTLGVINAYIPRVTSFQDRVMSVILNSAARAKSKLDDLLNAGNQANDFLGNLDVSSKPLGEQFIDAMENIYYGKQLVAIDMPYRRYDSMVITSISIKRDNSGEAIQFTVNAQRFRVAEIAYAAVSKKNANPAPSSGKQTAGVKDIGTQTGAKKPESFLFHYNPFQYVPPSK